MGQYLYDQLVTNIGKIDGVLDIRGMGLIIGIEISGNVPEVLSSLRTKGLIALPAGEKVIRLLPPLTITEAEVIQAVGILETTIANVTSAV
jgi:acetylornithine/N-succinyldiaminopimelate aminotransferase